MVLLSSRLSWRLPDKGALLVLNLASNDLGQLVLPEGWSAANGKHAVHNPEARLSILQDKYGWYEQHTNGTDQKEHPGKA
jgi:hypothetical protein